MQVQTMISHSNAIILNQNTDGVLPLMDQVQSEREESCLRLHRRLRIHLEVILT